jgi:hypothetical protein
MVNPAALELSKYPFNVFRSLQTVIVRSKATKLFVFVDDARFFL